MLTFRLAVVHSLPSAILLEEAIVAGTFWSVGEGCVALAAATNPHPELPGARSSLLNSSPRSQIWKPRSRQPMTRASTDRAVAHRP